ncbi:MAG: 16S rRNA (cytidine(1402)-2'-O)-methyltransferase [Deferribacterales bacterium]
MSSNPLLSFVPTPVGNLGDITLRAVETLRAADIVFAEDTRTALKLLSHLGIRVKVESFHKDNEKKTIHRITELLGEGKKISVISEAGSPCISDPGMYLSAALREAQIPFEALPGATAFVPALTLSGFDTSDFYFRGFLPHKLSEKKSEIEKLRKINSLIVLYESPHRAAETLKLLIDNFPLPVSLSREITKLHEETLMIRSEEDINALTLKGEFVFVVNNRKEEKEEEKEDFRELAETLIKEGLSAKDCLTVLKALGVKRNAAYSAINEIINR